MDALGTGLALALLPSLLLALEDPLSMRGVLVGAAGVAALALGVRERLAAPLLAGAATIALLAVRELAAAGRGGAALGLAGPPRSRPCWGWASPGRRGCATCGTRALPDRAALSRPIGTMAG